MAVLIPAILTRESEEVYEKIKFLESIPEVSEVHIDFEDGSFVPNETVLPQALRKLDTRLVLEGHMMVRDPHHYFYDLEHIGIHNVIMHFESFQRFEDLVTSLDNARHFAFMRGVAINPETPVEVFRHLSEKIEIALLMSVHPGFQGKPFVPESILRLEAMRQIVSGAKIEVDGAIKLENLHSVVASGAERVVVGSGIWHSPDPKRRIYELLEKLK